MLFIDILIFRTLKAWLYSFINNFHGFLGDYVIFLELYEKQIIFIYQFPTIIIQVQKTYDNFISF